MSPSQALIQKKSQFTMTNPSDNFTIYVNEIKVENVQVRVSNQHSKNPIIILPKKAHVFHVTFLPQFTGQMVCKVYFMVEFKSKVDAKQ